MVQCKCGKHVERIPEWLSGVKVDFICNNCPNRKAKNIAFVSLETAPSTPKVDLDEVDDLPEDDAEEVDA